MQQQGKRCPGILQQLAENSPQDCKVSQRFGPAASFRLKNKKDLPDHIIHPGTHRWGT
jgi:hypothetical protein